MKLAAFECAKRSERAPEEEHSEAAMKLALAAGRLSRRLLLAAWDARHLEELDLNHEQLGRDLLALLVKYVRNVYHGKVKSESVAVFNFVGAIL